MEDAPIYIYVAVGTVYDDKEEIILLYQEYMECETYEQASEQTIAMEERLRLMYPTKKIMTWINQC